MPFHIRHFHLFNRFISFFPLWWKWISDYFLYYRNRRVLVTWYTRRWLIRPWKLWKLRIVILASWSTAAYQRRWLWQTSWRLMLRRVTVVMYFVLFIKFNVFTRSQQSNFAIRSVVHEVDGFDARSMSPNSLMVILNAQITIRKFFLTLEHFSTFSNLLEPKN